MPEETKPKIDPDFYAIREKNGTFYLVVDTINQENTYSHSLHDATLYHHTRYNEAVLTAKKFSTPYRKMVVVPIIFREIECCNGCLGAE